MSKAGKIARLVDRGVVTVTGPDASAFLDNMITNDMANLDAGRRAIFGGLLTPQGKILYEFFVIRAGEGYLLDTQRAKVADLVKRLSMYKLRSKVEIRDVSNEFDIVAVWGLDRLEGTKPQLRFDDSRNPKLATRCYLRNDEKTLTDTICRGEQGDWRLADEGWHDTCRVKYLVPEGDRDYPLGDTFPHEANWEQMNGVSFTKGCYVGQEVVARMQNKTVVRKRVVRIAGASLVSGRDILHGEGVIGKIGTVAGDEALALIRLDRAAEAEDKGDALLSDGHPVHIDPAAIADYRAASANRRVIDL